MPRTEAAGFASKCKVCAAMEPKTIDRLLVIGYGPSFIAARWGLPRHKVKQHRDECLVGERRQAVEADLQRMVEESSHE